MKRRVDNYKRILAGIMFIVFSIVNIPVAVADTDGGKDSGSRPSTRRLQSYIPGRTSCEIYFRENTCTEQGGLVVPYRVIMRNHSSTGKSQVISYRAGKYTCEESGGLFSDLILSEFYYWDRFPDGRIERSVRDDGNPGWMEVEEYIYLSDMHAMTPLENIIGLFQIVASGDLLAVCDDIEVCRDARDRMSYYGRDKLIRAFRLRGDVFFIHGVNPQQCRKRLWYEGKYWDLDPIFRKKENLVLTLETIQRIADYISYSPEPITGTTADILAGLLEYIDKGDSTRLYLATGLVFVPPALRHAFANINIRTIKCMKSIVTNVLRPIRGRLGSKVVYGQMIIHAQYLSFGIEYLDRFLSRLSARGIDLSSRWVKDLQEISRIVDSVKEKVHEVMLPFLGFFKIKGGVFIEGVKDARFGDSSKISEIYERFGRDAEIFRKAEEIFESNRELFSQYGDKAIEFLSGEDREIAEAMGELFMIFDDLDFEKFVDDMYDLQQLLNDSISRLDVLASSGTWGRSANLGTVRLVKSRIDEYRQHLRAFSVHVDSFLNDLNW